MSHFQDSFYYLIHLVRCAIHDKAPSELPVGAMFDSVYKCAVSHDIANIAYYSIERLQNKPEAALLKKWEARRNSAIIREMNQSFARDEIVEALGEAGIRCAEVQGTRLKELYPSPEYRTMSDIDFIVEPKNLGDTRGILEKLGYDCHYFRDFDVDGFREPNIYVEMHTSFFAKDTDFHGFLGDPFAEAKDTDGASVTVSEETLYLYTVLHTAKHYYFAGCGIRRVLDLYLLNRAYPHIAESEKVKSFFEELGLSDFVGDMCELAQCWFGEDEKVPDERLSKMVETIKKSGIHGTVSQKLANSLARNKSKGIRNVKTAYVLRRLFPEKWVMVANYPVLKKLPILMPFCWIHRNVKAVTKNRGRLSEEIKNLKNADLK